MCQRTQLLVHLYFDYFDSLDNCWERLVDQRVLVLLVLLARWQPWARNTTKTQNCVSATWATATVR